ncbi:MAG TPA: threonine ammonia-lyase, biosynthetic [Gammaproteobacteria bacterium]|jgi:threonine dehydratase|nr:threonine ammonia-lyase, biosynthetic [Gammaproteobacteria bacterium]
MSTVRKSYPVAASYAPLIARAQVYDVAIESPLDRAPRLSKRLGHEVLLKREDLQAVFSFKLRGAYNRMAHLPAAALAKGVICSSAGNHAQGVALAARRRGVRAVIVMPTSTPSIKVDAVAALGGEIVLEGATFDDAYAYAMQLRAEQDLTFVHPFNDPDVIAGQATVGIELERQWPQLPAAVFVPIGGGGLVSGVGAYLKNRHPGIRIVGVEPLESASMYESLKRGAPFTLDRVGTFAEGVAVRRVGDETFRVASEVVDEIILVSTDEICAAIKDIFEDSRVIVEPAGALGVAGLKRYVERGATPDGPLIAINSGANMNFDRLRHVAERAEIGEHREAVLAVEIPEQPGAFLRFCEALGTRNITEFNYRYAPGTTARIFVGVSLQRGLNEAAEIVALLKERGYPVLDLSDNELAKLHVRHLVGGQVPGLKHELLYRFEFPERPGALRAFLQAVGDRWNISLFHYRNHGSDYGRVLAGVQVPPADRAKFTQHLARLGYTYADETENPAYRLFLRSAD